MLIQQKCTIIVPSKELGQRIAREPADVQKQVLTGMAEEILPRLTSNRQPIISLAAILPPQALLWLAMIYKEALKNGQVKITD